MGRPAKNGAFDFRIKAQKCNRTCPDYETCTIRLDPDGKCTKRDRREYYVKYIYIMQVNGKKKRKEVYGKTVEELSAKVAKYAEEKGISSATLGDWLEVWERDYVTSSRMKSATCKFYRSLLKYIPETLRKKALADIRPLDFERLQTDLLEKGGKKGTGLSTKTVRSVRTMLISCLDRAIENGLLAGNVGRHVRPPKLVQKEIDFLTQDQIQTLLAVSESGEYYAGLEQAMQDDGSRYLIRQWAMVIRLALATGMRRGEVFGLTWDCVDLDGRSVNVKWNLQGGKLESPKTKNSVRSISIDVDTASRLREWQEYQAQYAGKLGDMFQNNVALLFTTSFGRCVNFDNFRCRYFDRMILKAGLPDTVTFHSLRHTHATQLLAAGVDAKTVSSRLGHSSVAFTLRTYVHVLDEVERGAADVMGKILAGNN